jgi:hypothetical protein
MSVALALSCVLRMLGLCELDFGKGIVFYSQEIIPDYLPDGFLNILSRVNLLISRISMSPLLDS